ncbi:kinase-like domain-containing protein [Glomus cerebriforme]|uniref:Kinase-like domain-containing protein n=1 Tax=Glomus cerebriforme TaxID=658196 RepID=A0A397T207_9GLOM|nr:kinase-like domain-containing protein [Glomus cerebriforme]
MSSNNKECEKCGNYKLREYCKLCQINYLKDNFKNWTSENIIIDDFIQQKQLQINFWENVFEWIPYDQFNDIKKIGKAGFATAIWKDGPLKYNRNSEKYERNLNENVVLKYLYNSQNISSEFLNEAKSYLTSNNSYGISQNPDTEDYILVFFNKYFEEYCENCSIKYLNKWNKWCKLCQINYLKDNFKNWTSGNVMIDDFIQQKQLQINFWENVFEWIPYDQFNDIKKIEKAFATAIWKDGPLKYNHYSKKYERNLNENVVLKYLYNSQNIFEFLNKVNSYLTVHSYGISQTPDTNYYILVFSNKYFEEYCENCGKKNGNKWCEPCQKNHLKDNFKNWTSGNEIIDYFIQQKQLQINFQENVFEWISYDQFNDIKKIGKAGFATAIWKDGPLRYNHNSKKYERDLNKNVVLKYLYNSQNISSKFLNKVNSYLTIHKYCENCGEKYNDSFEITNKWCEPCQMNQNKKINDLIKDMQFINYDSLFEFVTYDQFNNIKKIGKGGFSTVYSAIWKNGPVRFNTNIGQWIRKPNKKVALKCLYNSQNFIDKLLSEVKAYSNRDFDSILKIYGISQNPNTMEYIIILEYAEGGNFNDYLNRNYEKVDWLNKLQILIYIIEGLKEIHQKQMVHRDFHIGNILFKYIQYNNTCISDMGLCGEVCNVDETNIYGVMPYVAPEVLRGKLYTQAADIYSFGMIMYFVAIWKQPFDNRAHNEILALDICNGIRPKLDELNELKIPTCYIDLMKKCWNSTPENRPNATEIEELIWLFRYSYALNASEFESNVKIRKEHQHYEIEKQFKEAEEYRKANPLSIENNQSTTHPQAIYTSRLLNRFTKDLINSECLDCAITD